MVVYDVLGSSWSSIRHYDVNTCKWTVFLVIKNDRIIQLNLMKFCVTCSRKRRLGVLRPNLVYKLPHKWTIKLTDVSTCNPFIFVYAGLVV